MLEDQHPQAQVEIPINYADDIHRNLMVNYLPDAWTNSELESLFQQYGPLERSNIVVDKKTGLSKGYGFVKYLRREDAESAIASLNGFQIDTRTLVVKKAAFGSRTQQGPTSIYIAGFGPGSMDETQLRQMFEKYGTITRVKIHTPQPGKKGVAFVTYECFSEAEAAASGANGAPLDGDEMLTVRVYTKPTTAEGIPASTSNRSAQPSFNDGLPKLNPLPMVMLPPSQQHGGGLATSSATMSTQASVYIAGFTPSLVGEAQIKQIFDAFGRITRVKQHPSQPGKKGVAFVTYESLAEAENAVLNANGAMLTTGDVLTVKIDKKTNYDVSATGAGAFYAGALPAAAAAAYPSAHAVLPFGAAASIPGPVTLYVAGFTPQQINEAYLQQLFAAHGAIQRLRLHPSQPGKKGVAFVTFSNGTEAESALRALNGAVLSTGDTLTVKLENKAANSSSSNAGSQALQPQHHPVTPASRRGVASQHLPGQGGPMATPSPNGADGNYCIFVYGIEDPTLLRTVVSAYGTISNIKTQPGKKFSLVSMPNVQQAMTLISSLNNAVIPGVPAPLQVRLASDRTNGGGKS